MATTFLSGGQQTTVNSTITELFPALCFNNGYNPKNPEDLENFINGVDLKSTKSKRTFVNENNIKAGKEFIVLKNKIRPAMREEKIQNAYAITKFLFFSGNFSINFFIECLVLISRISLIVRCKDAATSEMKSGVND